MADIAQYACLGCCGCTTIWAIIILITILANIRTLGPEEQILIHGPQGKYVVNGPQGPTVVHPFRKKESRKAFRIGVREYLVVKNQRSGLIRHEEGDGQSYFFLGAWDDSLGLKTKNTLRQNQYMRLVDELTGYERIVKGPTMFAPNPLEHSPNDIEVGIIISSGKSVITLNKTSGIRNIHQITGLFIPEAYEEIIAERASVRVDPQKYAKIKDMRTGEIRHEEGPSQLYLGPYDEMLRESGSDAKGLYPKIILQTMEYSRLVHMGTGVERVVKGPKTFVPAPREKFKVPGVIKQKGITIAADTGVLVIDRKTGVERLETQVGLFIPDAYEEVIEFRNSTLLSAENYAVLRSTLTGEKRHVEGPARFLQREYEVLLEIHEKWVLQRDEYIRLVNQRAGTERVVAGPKTFVPQPEEWAPDGVQKSIFIDWNTSLIILDRTTGFRRLETQQQTNGTFVPAPYETILEQRSRVSLFSHETMIVRDNEGQLSIRDGSTTQGQSFFLQPYEVPIVMEWSIYDLDHANGASPPKESVMKVSNRINQMYFMYEARTNDNVKLMLNGTIRWKVKAPAPTPLPPNQEQPVVSMVKTTTDPVEDIWYHCRSQMIQAVGSTGIEEFTANMTQVSAQALQNVLNDVTFYDSRGVEVESMELSGKEPVDQSTKDILDQITSMGIDLQNQIARQETANQVAIEELKANLTLEQERNKLITAESANLILEARTQGEAEGLAELEGVKTFLDDLGTAVTDESERIEMYKFHETMKGRTVDIQNMKNGNLKLFMTPDNMDIRMDMSGLKDQYDQRRLSAPQLSDGNVGVGGLHEL